MRTRCRSQSSYFLVALMMFILLVKPVSNDKKIVTDCQGNLIEAAFGKGPA
jgi:hypothetical protein